MIEFVLDGTAVQAPDDAGSLLDALRDHLGVRSVKDGCSPQGQCGCCTVWVDGQPRVACVTPVGRVAGRSITTFDGLPDAAQWAERLCVSGGTQCGFCTPGFVMATKAFCDKNPGATLDQVRKGLGGNICRCGTYVGITACAMELVKKGGK